MLPNKAQIVTISLEESFPFRLSDVLNTIGEEKILALNWKVLHLDCTSNEAQKFCDEVSAEPDAGIWISGKKLVEVISTCGQVIEGLLIGFPTEHPPQQLVVSHDELRRFPQSKAEVAIEIIDGEYVDVYLRDDEIVACLEQTFENISRPDPLLYFSAD